MVKRFSHAIKKVTSGNVATEGFSITKDFTVAVTLPQSGHPLVLTFSGTTDSATSIVILKLIDAIGRVWKVKWVGDGSGTNWSVDVAYTSQNPITPGRYIMIAHKCSKEDDCDRIVHYIPFDIQASPTYGTIGNPLENATVYTDFSASGTYVTGDTSVTSWLVDGHQNTYNCSTVYMSGGNWNTSYSRIPDGLYTLTAQFNPSGGSASISITVSRNAGGG